MENRHPMTPILQRLFPGLLALALLLPAMGQEGPPTEGGPATPPTPEQVQQAVTALKAGSKDAQVSVRLDAVRTALQFPAEEVVDALGKYALKDKEPAVVASAIAGLGTMAEPAALDLLLSHGKRARKSLEKDPATHALLIQSIGRHASPKALRYLSDDLFGSTHRKVVQARILAIARIRTEEAVEVLIAMSRKAGTRHDQFRHGDDMRLALCVLTGEDLGNRPASWTRWWNDNKKSLEISAEPSPLPKGLAKSWDRYWSVPKEKPSTPRPLGGL